MAYPAQGVWDMDELYTIQMCLTHQKCVRFDLSGKDSQEMYRGEPYKESVPHPDGSGEAGGGALQGEQGHSLKDRRAKKDHQGRDDPVHLQRLSAVVWAVTVLCVDTGVTV